MARILLPYILDRGKSYGRSHSPKLTDPDALGGTKPRVIVEFSSPNLGKEFDGAHLRSTIVGSFISALYESMGWDVCRMNFLGDWGKHIGLLAVGWSMFGSDELLEIEPLRHLLSVYTDIAKLSKSEQQAAKDVSGNPDNQADVAPNPAVPISTQQDDFFKKMEEGDSDALALWKRLRDVCVKEYTKLYAQLHINFDDFSGESQVTKSTIAEVEAVLTEKGIYEDNNRAWVIDFSKHGSKGLGTANLRHANGTTSYLLRDIGAVLERRKKHAFDKMVYVVSARQDSHFQQLFRTLGLMGDVYHEIAQTLQHVSFSNVRGLSPQPGRSGLLLGDILEQSRHAMPESLQSSGVDDDGALDDASEFARLALASQELSTKRSNTVDFALGIDEKVAAPLEIYPGLTVQRWLDSLRSRIHGAEATRNFEDESLDYTFFSWKDEYADMLRLIARFPDITKHAFERLDPSIIFSYLLQVIDMLPSVWDADEDEESSEHLGPPVDHENAGEESESRAEASQVANPLKLAFYDCVRTVLENGMEFIGLVSIKGRGRKPAETVIALHHGVSNDTTPIAVTKEDKTTLPAVSEEETRDAEHVTAPGGVDEVIAEVCDVQDIDDGAESTAVTQEDVQSDEPTTMPQDDEESDELTTRPQEEKENEDLVTIPQKDNQNDETTPMAQEDKENDEPILEPENNDRETDTTIIFSQEADETPALDSVSQETMMTEAEPAATPHSEEAAPESVSHDEEATSTAAPEQGTTEIATTTIQHEVNEDPAPTSVPGEAGET